MTPDQILDIKRRAEICTGPCSVRTGETDGVYAVCGPDGKAILFSTLPDLATLNFYAASRETTLDLCAEILRLETQLRATETRIAELQAQADAQLEVVSIEEA